MKAKHASPRSGARRPRRGLPAMEWVEDITGRCARTTAIGSRKLLVENHTEILFFSEDGVRLATGQGLICVFGSGLLLRDVRPGALIVEGDIRRVELPCEGGAPSDEG